jgi:ABC-type glycerol-3-phosphate transport system substrate-binding protein
MNALPVMRAMRGLVATLAALASAWALAQPVVKVDTLRSPSYEILTKRMQGLMPDVKVVPTLLTVDKLIELYTIRLSARSDALDLMYVNDGIMRQYAKNGWLQPIDDLWEKYRKEYNLDDYVVEAVEAMRYEGKLYAIPVLSNTMLFAYRADLFKEKGMQPPKTFAEYLVAAEAFNSPRRAGTVMPMKLVEGVNTAHWYMNAIGKGWLDANRKPAFNNPDGVKAIDTMKQMARFAPPGYTSHGNDESTLSLGQDLAVMGGQWVTRAAAMDDPKKSSVVGRIEWVVPPGGGQPVVFNGFAMSKFSKADRDLMFRLAAGTTDAVGMKQAAATIIPVRTSVLTDPELVAKFRFYPVIPAALKAGKRMPDVPEFGDVTDILSRSLQEAVTGQKPVKGALDEAAQRVDVIFKERGVY